MHTVISTGTLISIVTNVVKHKAIWNLLPRVLKCQPMRSPSEPLAINNYPECPIAVSIPGTCPQPTTVSLLNLCPKGITQRHA